MTPINKTELKKLVAKLCDTSSQSIEDSTMLIGDLKMDSIKIVELLATLSEEYNIHATEHDAANFNTFNDLYRFTQRNKQT